MHDEQQRAYGLGDAIEDAMKDAWFLWWAQYAPSRARDEAFATEVNLMETTVQQLQAGRLRINVMVKARRPWQSDQFWYQYQRQGDDLYTLVGST